MNVNTKYKRSRRLLSFSSCDGILDSSIIVIIIFAYNNINSYINIIMLAFVLSLMRTNIIFAVKLRSHIIYVRLFINTGKL